MGRYKKHETLQVMRDTRLVGLFHNGDPETALDILKCCSAGGLRVVEFVNRGDGAPEIFARLAKAVKTDYPDIVLGAGSVLEGATAGQYINMGADFIVSPCMSEDAAKVCNARKIPYMPGCGTASEIMNAHLLGVDICKLFPGGASGGPALIKGVLAPMPFAEIMPTGGVEPTEENCRAWFDAGAVSVGMGSKLIDSKMVSEKRFDELTDKIRECVYMINKLKGACRS